MKRCNKAVLLLLALLCAFPARALPSFDPFSDASASGGTTYANGDPLYHQVNAMGERWAKWNGNTTSFQVTCTNLGLSYTGFPSGFLEPSLTNAVYLPGQADRAGGGAGLSAALTFSSSVQADPNNQVANTVFASFLLKVSNLGNLDTNAPIYFAGFATNTADQSVRLPASAMKLFLKGNADTGSSTAWSIGVANNSGSASAAWAPGTHSSNEVLFVVVAYQFGINSGPDLARLWVNPAPITFGALAAPPPSATTAGITGADRIARAADFFLLARTGQTLWGGLLVSSLRVGTSWSYVTGGPDLPPCPPTHLSLSSAGTNLILSASGGKPGTFLSLSTCPTLAMPVSRWSFITTGAFDADGRFSFPVPRYPTARQQFYALQTYGQTLHDLLDSTLFWFLNSPPNADGSNYNARWLHTALIDQYGWELSTTTWHSYRDAWKTDPAAADALEDAWPILYYLRKADQRAYTEIRYTPVTQGFILWHLYNMGYVVKTRDKCFAIDLVARDSTDLVGLLDFAICSHSHTDHYDVNFLNAMVAAGKPVFSPFYSKGTVVTTTNEYNFGEVNVRFTPSHQQTDVPVIISQINLGPGANGYTIYDIADARPLTDLNPTRHINLFILHVANGLNIFDAVARVHPDDTIYAHEMELGHSISSYRWSYDFAYDKVNSQPHASTWILTWGERIDGR